MPDKPNRYTQIIEDIFFQHYDEGATVVAFKRSEIVETAKKLNIELPKNLGDITYSFRYRVSLPERIRAKAPADQGIIQIEQDLAMCAAKFSDLICRPVAAQFLKNGAIALFELEQTDRGIAVSAEKHYRLVAADELSPQELQAYRLRSL
jgi:hypothetical protein